MRTRAARGVYGGCLVAHVRGAGAALLHLGVRLRAACPATAAFLPRSHCALTMRHVPGIAQGYRLCCDFSVPGLVNIVGDLVSDDVAVNNGKALCGFVYAGCGSGRDFAEARARGMFDVLCASLARVLCLNKDRHDAQKICEDVTRRLRNCVGIVSLRGVLEIDGKGEFLQHETYCFQSRFLVSDSPEEVLEIVRTTFKKRRVAPDSCHASPTLLPLDAAAPADTKSSGDVIAISDDEGDGTPARARPPPPPKTEANGLPQSSDASPPRTKSPASREPSIPDRPAAPSHAPSPPEASAAHAQAGQAEEDDDDGSWLNGRSNTKNKSGPNHTPLQSGRSGLSAGAAASKARMPAADPSPSAVNFESALCSGSSGAAVSRRGGDKLNATEDKLQKLKQEVGSAGSARSKQTSPDFVSLSERFSDVASQRRNGATARSGHGDIRSHFTKSDGDAPAAAADSQEHEVLILDIKEGCGAEVKKWHVNQPSFFAGFSEDVPVACLGGARAQDRHGAQCDSIAELDWDKEQAFAIWQRRFKAYEQEFNEHRALWDTWVSCIPDDLVGEDGCSNACESEVAKRPNNCTDETAFQNSLEAPSNNLLSRHEVVVERTVLAAIVDIAFGDVEHEGIGLLYGWFDAQREQVIVTECESLKREPNTLDRDSVKLPFESFTSAAINRNGKDTSKTSAKEVGGGNTGKLVGWFHTHLNDQPLPSTADADVHQQIAANSCVQKDFVGLICSLDAESRGAASDCRRVTFTAFRGKTAGKDLKSTRVAWRVQETPALSPEAVQSCLDSVKKMEQENRELCTSLAGDMKSHIKHRWLHGKWEDYIIRLLQGTVPLLLNQLEQSRRNLRIQRAQIVARLAKQRLKGLPWANRATAREAAASSSSAKERGKRGRGQSTHRMNCDAPSHAAGTSSAETKDTLKSGGGAFNATAGRGHSDAASAGKGQDNDGDMGGTGKERASKHDGERRYSKAAAGGSSGKDAPASGTRPHASASGANSPVFDRDGEDHTSRPPAETGRKAGAFKNANEKYGGIAQSRAVDSSQKRKERVEKRKLGGGGATPNHEQGGSDEDDGDDFQNEDKKKARRFSGRSSRDPTDDDAASRSQRRRC